MIVGPKFVRVYVADVSMSQVELSLADGKKPAVLKVNVNSAVGFGSIAHDDLLPEGTLKVAALAPPESSSYR
jgi:hypothetical protein